MDKKIDLIYENHDVIWNLVNEQDKLLGGYVPATDEVAKCINPPVTGGQLRSKLSSWASKVGWDRRKAREARTNKHVPTPAPENRRSTCREIYMRLIEGGYVIPSDRVLALVTDLTHSAFGGCRDALKRNGYVFEPASFHGWRCVGQPEPAMPPPPVVHYTPPAFPWNLEHLAGRNGDAVEAKAVQPAAVDPDLLELAALIKKIAAK